MRFSMIDLCVSDGARLESQPQFLSDFVLHKPCPVQESREHASHHVTVCSKLRNTELQMIKLVHQQTLINKLVQHQHEHT
jgi:hypothetical protein